MSNSPTPDAAARAPKGVATWAFEPTPRISSYITALIAGPYQSVHSELTSSSGRVIPLGVYARKSLFQYLDADYIFDITRKGFAYYEEKFGYPYPFAKYDQLFVPEFNAGAMENAGAVTFTETYVFRSKVTDAIKERRVVTILHELAHMWFGDLVTMKLVERPLAERVVRRVGVDDRDRRGHRVDRGLEHVPGDGEELGVPAGPAAVSTHPIVATINDLEDVQVNFDGITYAKGGSVLKQLAAWVGIEAFFAGVGAYFKKHEYGNTELTDLLAELEATSGRDLSGWARPVARDRRASTRCSPRSRPTRTASSPRSASCRPRRRTTRRSVRTASPSASTTSPTNGDDDSPKLVRTHRVELDVDGDLTEVAELRRARRSPNLVLLNDDDLAYAKIRLDDESLDTAIAHLARHRRPARPRARLGLGLGLDPRRRGRRRATTSTSCSATSRPRPSRPRSGSRSPSWRRWPAPYVAPEKQDATIRRVGDALWQLAQDAEAGSDAQFQFVKFFANLASTPEHGDVLARPARRIDQARRASRSTPTSSWELLEGLVLRRRSRRGRDRRGARGGQHANGQQAAARRPRHDRDAATASSAALDAALTDATIPNVVLRNMGLGFQHVNDAGARSRRDRRRYFDALAADLEGAQLPDRAVPHPGLLPRRRSPRRVLVDATQRLARREPGRAGAAPPRDREPRGRRARARAQATRRRQS